MSVRILTELLESRRLFAAVPVNGTAGNDVIEIAKGSTAYVVTVNGVATQHAIGDVSAINIFCSEGDDVVLIAANVTLGVYADGGNGNDKIIGGDDPDTFLGAAGKDQIYGGLGNDRINGAGGNDKVFGEAGGDRVYGGDGNDYVDGGSSRDRLYGGSGADSVFGQGGDDNFFAIDGAIDQLFGGSGTDSAFADAGDLRSSVEHVAIV
ncbi:MAG: calcium-binding protein [Tepidisphaeraceae bacterium]